MHSRLFAMAAALSAVWASGAQAQSLGGVFPPMVNEGHKSAQYRAAYDPDAELFANRVHYQQALNGDVMLRGIVATRDTRDSAFDFDFVQGELFWDLSEDRADWRTGVRFDARVRGDGRPGQLGFNWMNQFDLGGGWRSRFVVLSSADIGDDARDGVFLQTRADVAYKLDSGQTVGVELFNGYGSTEDIRDFEDQSHTIGPFVVAPVTEDWSIFAGALFGLTDASRDTDLRFWVTRRF